LVSVQGYFKKEKTTIQLDGSGVVGYFFGDSASKLRNVREELALLHCPMIGMGSSNLASFGQTLWLILVLMDILSNS
jgi:hypothetical protein